jgi:fluoride ion exporter CrcB/FEX
MHPDADLVSLFRGVRQDARSDPTPTEVADTFPIIFGFDGVGALPTVGMVCLMDLGQLKARINGATIIANGVGSAVISVQLGTFSDLPNLSTIYGSGLHPTLTAASSVVLDTTLWRVNLQPADVLIVTLISVSSVITPPTLGALTCVSLSLHCRRLKWPAGSSQLTDGSGNSLTNAGGNTVTLRS